LTTQITTSTNSKGAKTTTVHYGTATFKIKVSNTGDVMLHNVTVTDPLSPGCNKNIGTLAPGSSSSYTCERGSVSTSFTNVAKATGTAPNGTKVSAVDHAKVAVGAKTSNTSGAKFTG
jgi:uncharacterized repeat protein (TIGR01451 family)